MEIWGGEEAHPHSCFVLCPATFSITPSYLPIYVGSTCTWAFIILEWIRTWICSASHCKASWSSFCEDLQQHICVLKVVHQNVMCFASKCGFHWTREHSWRHSNWVTLFPFNMGLRADNSTEMFQDFTEKKWIALGTLPCFIITG